MLLYEEINHKGISLLVDKFYAKVRRDEMIGPVFNTHVADWPEHLVELKRFWATVMLGTKEYKGSPFLVHMALKNVITKEHFIRWLALFKETLFTIFVESVATLFIAKSQHIAEALQLGMFPPELA